MILLFGSLAVFLLLSVPVGVSIGLAVALFLFFGNAPLPLSYIATNMFTSIDSFPLLAIPFFILSGGLMDGGGISKRLINLFSTLLCRIRGHLAIVAVVACAFFGAISGSAPATVAAIGAVVVPYMVKDGYPPKFSIALVAAAGCLGIIIPPSIPMVMFGVATGASIGGLFTGGFGPGICATILLSIVAYVLCKKNGYGQDVKKFSWRAVSKAFLEAIWALVAPIIILGGIYGGIFTPTEAAVVAVIYALLAGIFIYKELTFKKFIESLANSCQSVGAIMLIVCTGMVLGKVLALENVPAMVKDWLLSATDSRFVILLLINIILLITGCFCDTTAAILILSPILYPVASAFGVNILHFGVMMVFNLAVGYLTPPVGINLYTAMMLRPEVSFKDMVKQVIPFLITMVAVLLMLTYIPDIILFIPRIFGYV